MGWRSRIKNLAGSVGIAKGFDQVGGLTLKYGQGLFGASPLGYAASYLFKDKIFEQLGLNGNPNAGIDYEGLRRELQVQESDAATEAAFLRRQALSNNLL